MVGCIPGREEGDFNHRLVESEVKVEAEVKVEEEEVESKVKA